MSQGGPEKQIGCFEKRIISNCHSVLENDAVFIINILPMFRSGFLPPFSGQSETNSPYQQH